jgi:hypothetical protein
MTYSNANRKAANQERPSKAHLRELINFAFVKLLRSRWASLTRYAYRRSREMGSRSILLLHRPPAHEEVLTRVLVLAGAFLAA